MNIMANTLYKLGAALGLVLALSACAHQGPAALDEVGAPQVPATLSVEEADAKLKQSASERARQTHFRPPRANWSATTSFS